VQGVVMEPAAVQLAVGVAQGGVAQGRWLGFNWLREAGVREGCGV